MFLEYVAANPDCTVKAAARAAGVRRVDVRAALAEDEGFAEDYEVARGRSAEHVFTAFVEEAIIGRKVPIVSAGKIMRDDDGNILYELKRSERLLQTAFNALTPEGRAALGGKFGIEINTGGAPAIVQEGVPLSEVAAFMRQHVPGFQAELEAGDAAAEVVDVVDEPAE